MTRTGVEESIATTGHELLNNRGDRIRLFGFGARISSIELQTKRGPREVVLGYDSDQACLDDPYFMGCIAGRVCNRIAGGRFTIGNASHQLALDRGGEHLHGGPEGFFRRTWQQGGGATTSQAEFCLDSDDGDQGYPGKLQACVRYAWSDDRELRIRYAARSSRPTHVNLTSHLYFNLDASADTILGHRLMVDADSITETDDRLLPTGRILPTQGTIFDLSVGRCLREIVDGDDPAIRAAGGLDTNYVLSGTEPAAVLTSGSGDLALHVTTTCPGMQVYTGQHLATPFHRYGGICLETQYFPDAPNQPAFPSTLLLPGQLYSESTTYQFVES